MSLADPSTQSGGIVPGFPPTLPSQLEDAWLVLARNPQHASITPPSADKSVTIVLKKRPKSVWALAATCVAFGIIVVIAAWLFERYQSSDAYDLPIRFPPFKLYVVGWMCAGVGVMLTLINLASGGVDRDTVFHVSLGRLKIDRWVSGDHVVRDYTPEEINQIWADGAIEVGWRLAHSASPTSPAATCRMRWSRSSARCSGATKRSSPETLEPGLPQTGRRGSSSSGARDKIKRSGHPPGGRSFPMDGAFKAQPLRRPQCRWWDASP